MPMTILLSAHDLDQLLEPRALLEELRKAMIAYAAPGATPGLRAHSAIPASAPHSVMMVFPGLVPGIPAYTVKINAKRPTATPSVRGLIALIDLESGALLSVMDSIVITRLRTALIGALATDAMARRDIATVGVLGAGVQGRAQLRALALVRRFSAVKVYDTHPERATALAAELATELGVVVTPVTSVQSAVNDADVVIAATWATSPIVSRDMVRAGTHITAIGADEPGKAELSADLITASRFVCDDAALAVSMGALAGVGLGVNAVHATLGEVLAGRKAGRAQDEEITIFGSVGLPCQDLPAAWMAYNRSTRKTSTFDFHRA
jgi:ornithine cyclodeaminase/alanine dehydrogenase-like protein (mu-crystallin family)